jgi:alpha-N-acetylglucosamine transferase
MIAGTRHEMEKNSSYDRSQWQDSRTRVVVFQQDKVCYLDGHGPRQAKEMEKQLQE